MLNNQENYNRLKDYCEIYIKAAELNSKVRQEISLERIEAYCSMLCDEKVDEMAERYKTLHFCEWYLVYYNNISQS